MGPERNVLGRGGDAKGSGCNLVDLGGWAGLGFVARSVDFDGGKAEPANLQLEKEKHVFKCL